MNRLDSILRDESATAPRPGASSPWRRSLLRPALRWFNFALLIVTFAIVVRYLVKEMPSVEWAQLDPEILPLALAAFLTLLYMAFYALGWLLILHAVGLRGDWRIQTGIWGFSTSGKYYPGRIANLGYRAIMIGVHGKGSPQQVTLAWGLETACSILAGALILPAGMALLGLRELGGQIGLWDMLIPIAGFLALSLIGLYRPVRKAIFRILRLDQAVRHVGWSTFLGLTFYYLIAWALLGMILRLILSAFHISGIGTLEAILIYAAAGLSGMFSVVTPSGLGVREGAMILLLSGHFPSPLALSVALMARLLSTFGDGATILIGYALLKIFKADSASERLV